MLHDKDKENPGAVNIRVKRYNERHKEEINARRRAKRKLEKEEKEAIKPKHNSVVDSFNTSVKIRQLNSSLVKTSVTNKISNTIISEKSKKGETTEREVNTPEVPSSPTINEVLTVRFDL